ncbi:hypothetical protein BKA69DRAFT_1078261 [Paraphysoderma sedebokerense]|nr:hypothetical protein BKA69DRAFT_1078261 [Paraphysoderma sedebokerense]
MTTTSSQYNSSPRPVQHITLYEETVQYSSLDRLTDYSDVVSNAFYKLKEKLKYKDLAVLPLPYEPYQLKNGHSPTHRKSSTRSKNVEVEQNFIQTFPFNPATQQFMQSPLHTKTHGLSSKFSSILNDINTRYCTRYSSARKRLKLTMAGTSGIILLIIILFIAIPKQMVSGLIAVIPILLVVGYMLFVSYAGLTGSEGRLMKEIEDYLPDVNAKFRDRLRRKKGETQRNIRWSIVKTELGIIELVVKVEIEEDKPPGADSELNEEERGGESGDDLEKGISDDDSEDDMMYSTNNGSPSQPPPTLQKITSTELSPLSSLYDTIKNKQYSEQTDSIYRSPRGSAMPDRSVRNSSRSTSTFPRNKSYVSPISSRSLSRLSSRSSKSARVPIIFGDGNAKISSFSKNPMFLPEVVSSPFPSNFNSPRSSATLHHLDRSTPSSTLSRNTRQQMPVSIASTAASDYNPGTFVSLYKQRQSRLASTSTSRSSLSRGPSNRADSNSNSNKVPSTESSDETQYGTPDESFLSARDDSSKPISMISANSDSTIHVSDSASNRHISIVSSVATRFSAVEFDVDELPPVPAIPSYVSPSKAKSETPYTAVVNIADSSSPSAPLPPPKSPTSRRFSSTKRTDSVSTTLQRSRKPLKPLITIPTLSEPNTPRQSVMSPQVPVLSLDTPLAEEQLEFKSINLEDLDLDMGLDLDLNLELDDSAFFGSLNRKSKVEAGDTGKAREADKGVNVGAQKKEGEGDTEKIMDLVSAIGQRLSSWRSQTDEEDDLSNFL